MVCKFERLLLLSLLTEKYYFLLSLVKLAAIYWTYFLFNPKLSLPKTICYVFILFLIFISPLELCFDLFFTISLLLDDDMNLGTMLLFWLYFAFYVPYKLELGANPEDGGFFYDVVI